jgi:hypothetical protein
MGLLAWFLLAAITQASPAPAPAYSFAVFGDNQFGHGSCTSGTPEREAIPKAILEAKPTFVVHTGDLMDWGFAPGAYAQFERCYLEMLGALPFFPTAGNHDMGAGGIDAYRAFLKERLSANPKVYGKRWESDFKLAFDDDPTAYSDDPNKPANQPDLPSGFTSKTYYSFRFRSSYFVSMEVGTRFWTATPVSWLDRTLAAARADKTIDHIFVVLHHPLYSSLLPDDDKEHDSLGPVREAYEPVLKKYRVTAVLSGHEHLYMHYLVPADGHPTRADRPPTTYRRAEGIHHVTTGGGGGPLPACKPIAPEQPLKSHAFLQTRACGYHFTQVTVEGSRVTFDVWGVSGDAKSHTIERWDHFTIE